MKRKRRKMTNNLKRAVVLGGGGHFGIAWELGYLRGLEEAGLPIREADIFVGTSAGSQASVIVSSDKDWDLIWKEQIEKEISEITPISDEKMGELFKTFENIAKNSHSAKEWIAAEAEISKKTQPFISKEERLAMLKERYGSGQARWNSKLRIVATSIEDIERQVFDENSNVDILVALQASGALQGVWPSVEINGKHFFDGGSFSMENPDVIADADKMLVLSTGLPVDVPYKLEDLLAQLEKKGTETSLVLPSEKTMNILKDFNYNTVEAKIRPFVAQAGREQGQAEAAFLKERWL